MFVQASRTYRSFKKSNIIGIFGMGDGRGFEVQCFHMSKLIKVNRVAFRDSQQLNVRSMHTHAKS